MFRFTDHRLIDTGLVRSVQYPQTSHNSPPPPRSPQASKCNTAEWGNRTRPNCNYTGRSQFEVEYQVFYYMNKGTRAIKMNHPTFQFFSYGVFMLSEKTVFRQESKCLQYSRDNDVNVHNWPFSGKSTDGFDGSASSLVCYCLFCYS